MDLIKNTNYIILFYFMGLKIIFFRWKDGSKEAESSGTVRSDYQQLGDGSSSYEENASTGRRVVNAVNFVEHPVHSMDPVDILQYPIYLPDPLSYAALLPDNCATYPPEFTLHISADYPAGIILNHLKIILNYLKIIKNH